MLNAVNVDLQVDAALVAAHRAGVGVKIRNVYRFEAKDADGNVLWTEECENLLTTAGATDLLAKYLKGSAYTAAWFVGLKAAGTIAVGDTMASHAGWTEVTAYSQATRPALTLGTPAAGSVDNSAAPAAFSINGTTTIAGAFVASDSTKGGTAGVLYGAADFASARSMFNLDSLNVTVTLTAS